ncbi:hypothetical protein [Streptomyces sp. P9-A4]|uniref:hypothetical protein n=1 Tax=Streptomyces sp. P9-A4 TaxID=3072285 RepID=UPI002FCB2F2E
MTRHGEFIGEHLVDTVPAILPTEWRPLSAPYAVRARPGAAPLSWHDLDDPDVTARRWTPGPSATA